MDYFSVNHNAYELVGFLRDEYAEYWDFMKYQYAARDRGIQFFMVALGAFGALLGVLLSADDVKWLLVAVITFALALVAFLTFLKLLLSRKVIVETKRHLNGLRGKLLSMATASYPDSDEERRLVESFLFPTDPDFPRYRGGDISAPIFTSSIAVLSAAGAVAALAHSLNSYDKYTVVAAAATTALVCFLIWKYVDLRSERRTKRGR